jgi:hypothetical protein
VYVLDSPELANDLRGLAGHLFAIYGVPFRLAILPHNAGFAAANNAGVALARAPLVLLLNSDVLPDGGGWLGRMADFYLSTPDIGALAPKLLFEDDSLQHAGMYFRPTEDPGVWENLHFYKGMHRDVPAANVTRRVPAVTAACLMIDRELYRSLGGLRSIFIQGDYEDSDLCLRLAEAGYDTWYLADVELYHLEGQSYPGPLRASASRYNRWLHSRLWRSRIESLTGAGTDGRPAPAARLDITEVVPPTPQAAAVVQVHVDRPQAAERADEYSFGLAGWVRALHGPRVEALELLNRKWVFRRIPVETPRPDVAAAAGDEASAERCGFDASVNVLGLPLSFELAIRAVQEGGTRTHVGILRGRRRPLPPPPSIAIKPILVTTYGRTGSTYLTHLLGANPAIVAYSPFQVEPRLTAYWTEVLRRLSDPVSYTQSLATVLSSQDWWLGGDHVPPIHAPDAPVRDCLEGAGVERLADFCRGRIQEFYRQAAAAQGRERPVYFVEKSLLHLFNRTLARELFPGGREIFLIRDFRDMICSIHAYNARTNRVGFGREHVRTDEEFVLRIRQAAGQLLDAWRERGADALLVRYEDLIESPAPTLERILRYLDLEAGSGAAEAMLQRASEAGGGAERQHVTSPNVRASVGRWRRDLNERMQEICSDAFRDLLPEFGYS